MLAQSSESDRVQRLTFHDRGPWIFAMYWYSFQFRQGNGPEQRAMSFFGLSPALRAILFENGRTTMLARRFDLRSRVLLASCFIPGMVCLSAFIILRGLPGPLGQNLRDQYSVLSVALVGLAFLSLLLTTIFTRDLYRSFKALFEAYNAADVPSDKEDGTS